MIMDVSFLQRVCTEPESMLRSVGEGHVADRALVVPRQVHETLTENTRRMCVGVCASHQDLFVPESSRAHLTRRPASL